DLKTIIIDEWHELFGSKRGVLVELALSRIKTFRHCEERSDEAISQSPQEIVSSRQRAGLAMMQPLKIWGISATIGNLDQSMEVLLGKNFSGKKTMVVAENKKRIQIRSVIPDEIERFPWAGHLGVKLIDK